MKVGQNEIQLDILTTLNMKFLAVADVIVDLLNSVTKWWISKIWNHLMEFSCQRPDC